MPPPSPDLDATLDALDEPRGKPSLPKGRGPRLLPPPPAEAPPTAEAAPLRAPSGPIDTDLDDLIGQHAQKLQTSADGSTLWNYAKSAGDFTYQAVKGNIGGLGGEIVGGPVGGAVGAGAQAAYEAARGEEVPGLGGYVQRHGGNPLEVGAVSGAEWAVYGEFAKPIHFVADAAIEGMSPFMRRILTNAAARVGLAEHAAPPSEVIADALAGTKLVSPKQLLQTVAGGAAARVATTATVGGTIAGAFTAEQAALTGRAPKRAEIAKSVGMGAIIGAATGAFGPDVQQRIHENLPKILKRMGASDRAEWRAMNGVAEALIRDHKLAPADAAIRTGRAMIGIGSEVDNIAIRAVLKANPELAVGARLGTIAREETPPAFEQPNRDELTAYLASLESAGVGTDAYFRGIMPPPPEPELYESAMGAPPPLARPSVQAEGVPLAKTPATPPPKFNVRDYGTPQAIAEPLSAEEASGPRTVAVGEPTLGGTPVTAPAAQYVLPVGANPATDIPNVPELTLPRELSTPIAKKIMQLARGSSWEAFEKSLNGRVPVAKFIGMIKSGVLQPQHVGSPDVARTIAGSIYDVLDRSLSRTKFDAPFTPEQHQLNEAIGRFRLRALELRGEKPPTEPPVNDFVRGGGGEIVRQTKLDDSRVLLSDAAGRSAMVNRTRIRRARVEHIEPRDDALTSRDHLATLEEALNANDEPPTTEAVPPRAGLPPAPPAVERQLNELRRLNREATSLKVRLKKPKGAVAFPRGTRLTNATGVLAMMLRGDAYALPDGRVVTHIGGEFATHADEATAADFMRTLIKPLRQATEAKAALDGGTVSVPDVNSLINVSAVLRTLDRQAELARENTEGPPSRIVSRMVRATRGGQTAMGGWFFSGKTALRAMGPSGGRIVNLIDGKATVEEMTNGADLAQHGIIKRASDMPGVDRRSMENRSANPEAISIWERYALPILERQEKDAAFKGIADKPVFKKLSVPHLIKWKPEHFAAGGSGEMALQELRDAGIASSPEEAAHVLNDPDVLLPVTRGDIGAWDRIRRADLIATRLEDTLSTSRHDIETDFEDNLERIFVTSVKRRNRALAEAYLFGPHGERMTAELENIRDTFGMNSVLLAKSIIADSLGRVQLARGAGESILRNFARIQLLTSATRHVGQYAQYMHMFGFTPTVRTALHSLTSGALFGFGADARFARNVGASYAMSQQMAMEKVLTRADLEVDAGALSNAASRGMAFSEDVAVVGQLPLHIMLNGIRTVGAELGRREFDRYYDGALKGDAHSLSVLREIFGSKLASEDLGGMDREALRSIFAKKAADFGGLTLRPQDMPMFSRTPIGNFLMQFHNFAWPLTHNWVRAITSGPNRTRAILAAFVVMPALSHLDAEMRNRYGATTIDSAESEDAWDRLQRDPGIGRGIYAELQLQLNAHMFGMAGDFLQGMNIGSLDVMERPVTFAAAGLTLPVEMVYATAKMVHATMHHDRHERQAAVSAAESAFGPAGRAVATLSGNKKPIRLNKHQMLRDMLDF